MASLTGSIKIETDYRDPKWSEKEEAELAKVAEQIRGRNPGDKLSGEIIRFQIADGYAQYMVESSRPLRLVHLNVCDGYQVLGATIRGLRLADVEAMVARERRLAELFASKGGKS